MSRRGAPSRSTFRAGHPVPGASRGSRSTCAGNTARGDDVVRALALLYHDVVGSADWDASGFPGAVSAAYKFERTDFERHLAAVSATGARRGTVRDLLGSEPAPGRGQPPVLLTFDDGGASACGVADLLEGAGWRGHFLITTDYIGTAGFVTRD